MPSLSLLPADTYGRRMDMSISPTDPSPLATTSVSKAAQACLSCRKQKRKCDKTLPTCALCARMGRQCDYTDTPSAPTADDLAVLQARLAELENRLTAANAAQNSNGNGNGNGNGNSPPTAMDTSPASSSSVVPPSDSDPGSHSTSANSRPSVNSRGPLWMSRMRPTNFPSAIFLDIDCFKWAGMHVPKPNVDVPQDVYNILSHGNTIQDATAQYFECTHPWFPIISRKRMSIGTSLWEGGPDLAMLFLAMKLITYPACTNGTNPADNHLYTASKRFLALLESSGSLSLFHLQAMILITLYELGHGIYPSAWMSVAACARYVDIIGLPSFKDSSTILGSCTTWTEMEERRRAWWAVYILDRIVSLGNKKRFAMPEPEDHMVLPVDDAAWDAGDPGRSLQNSINTPLHVPQAPFARIAQAAMLISSILTHCRARIHAFRMGTSIAEKPDMAPVHALLADIAAFTDVTTAELSACSPSCSSSTDNPTTNSPSTYFARLTPSCLSASALILLLDGYSCPENLCDGPGANGMDSFSAKTTSELEMQMRAVTGLRTCALAVRDVSLEILEAIMLPAEERRVSPLCLDAVYCAMATLHWLWKEGGDAEIGEALEDVKNCLGRLAMRWGLAGGYLDMIHWHGVTITMALRAGFS